ncbi:uncharacterized protein [Haliotis cracherodii]|uniref:uncharacterized protein n=1 Tax=Haliotis cracherodii TaxID=6455 RepID=UPI0039EC8166
MDHSTVGFTIIMCFLFQGVTSQTCNTTHAEVCVREMEGVLNQVIETATEGGAAVGTLEKICLDTIKGNNLTQCYIDATAGCNIQGDEAPTWTMQRWERVMQDIYKLCDGACPSFLERTINITQCTSLIRFDSLYESSFGNFCRSLNDSLECAAQVTAECPMFARLFYDLLPQGVDQTANTICTAGCANFDEAMEVLETCKAHVMDLPEDLDTACKSYQQFKSCLHTSRVPVTCPMFGALLQVLYPQHIFGLYEQQCGTDNTTTSETEPDGDECGSRGQARVQHCIRVLALSWPMSVNQPEITEQQCRDYETGLRCLDHAGFHRCSVLRQFFHNMTSNRRNHMDVLQDECADFLTQQRQMEAGGVVTTVNLLLVVGVAVVSWAASLL